jgi:membrane protease YdiL (CAAX protease family)
MTSPMPSEPRTTSLYHGAFAWPHAVALTAAAVFANYAVQIAAATAHAPDLVVLSLGELAAATAVIVVAVRTRAIANVAARARLGVRMPSARLAIAAAMIGGSLWYVALALTMWLRPPGDPGALHRTAVSSALVPTLLAFAIVPAAAEELVFRGVLARSLALRFGPALAILASACMFSAYHLNPAQMIPTFVLGLALGHVALRADSCVPTMIGHALNNAIALTLDRGEVPRVGAWIVEHPCAMLAGCAATTIGGLALATRGGR